MDRFSCNLTDETISIGFGSGIDAVGASGTGGCTHVGSTENCTGSRLGAMEKSLSGELIWLISLNVEKRSSFSSNALRNEGPSAESQSEKPFSMLLPFGSRLSLSTSWFWLRL